MTDTHLIDVDLQTEDQLLILLRDKNYKVLMQLIDRDYRQQFRTEESGVDPSPAVLGRRKRI